MSNSGLLFRTFKNKFHVLLAPQTVYELYRLGFLDTQFIGTAFAGRCRPINAAEIHTQNRRLGLQKARIAARESTMVTETPVSPLVQAPSFKCSVSSRSGQHMPPSAHPCILAIASSSAGSRRPPPISISSSDIAFRRASDSMTAQ